MGDTDLLSKAGYEPLQYQRCQRNFRHQYNGLLPFCQHIGDQLHINLRFSAACHPMEQNRLLFLLLHLSADGIQRRRLLRSRLKGGCPFIFPTAYIPQYGFSAFLQNPLLQERLDGGIGDAAFFPQLCRRSLCTLFQIFQNPPLSQQPLILFCLLPHCFQKGMFPLQGKQPLFFFILAVPKLLVERKDTFFLHPPQQLLQLSCKFRLYILQRHLLPLSDEVHDLPLLGRQLHPIIKVQQSHRPAAFGADTRRQHGL